MSEPDGKDERPELLNERAKAVEQWFYQTLEDMDKQASTP